MKFVMFYHSFTSCWNHGNAHFLRGVTRELLHLGHDVTVYEPVDGWSRLNALRDGGHAALEESARLVPGVKLRPYRFGTLDLDEAVDQSDVVIAHEWNEPALIAGLGERRRAAGGFVLLFHDTHHRAVTAPDELGRFALECYDAVLAFGEVLRRVYQRLGWGRRVFTWHEAADVALFSPKPNDGKDADLVWIGNWGDGERDRELREFLLEPVRQTGVRARIHGVRYPESTLRQLAASGIEFPGWLPNHRVPEAFARARLTVHVPRRPYVETLPGIPTIRLFEALACGIPLVCAPWDDAEALFPDGSFVRAGNGEAATAAVRLLMADRAFAEDVARTGLQAVHARHTCTHRVRQLLEIIEGLRPALAAPAIDARRDSPRVAAS